MASDVQGRGPSYSIRAQANSDDVFDVLIYDTIGETWFGGISAEDLVGELAKVNAKTINVRINSFGGQVFEGLSIFNALERHAAHVVTHIDGVAASIASIIALAGDEVMISDNAFLMIHNPHAGAYGDSREMRKMADLLDKIGGSLAGVYARKSDMGEAEIQALMDAETWFTAAEAVEAGLAHSVTDEEPAMAASIDPTAWISKAPARIAAMLVDSSTKTYATQAGGVVGQAPDPVATEAPTHTKAPEARRNTMSESGTAAPEIGAEAIARAQEEARSAERNRVAEISALAQEHGISAEKVAVWTAGNTTIEEARVEALAEIKNRRAASVGTDVRVGADREAEAPFASFGDQVSAIVAAGTPTNNKPIDKRLLHQNSIHAAATGMSQGDPSSGGFVVSPQFSQVIWDGLNADEDSLLSKVDSYPVDGDSLTFNANAETSRATGSRWGGVQAYWLAEADQITASKPKFREAKVEPQELAVMVYLTNKLMRNAPALGQYATQAAIDEIGFMASDAIVRGTGVGKPLGLLNSASLVTVPKESSQAGATIVHNNITKMWSRVHPRARRDLIWLYNVDTEPELDNLFLPVTNVAGTENVGGINHRVVSYADDGTLRIKGRPAMPSEFCATLGTPGDLIAWSPSGYLAGIRSGVETDMSIHLRFDYAETALRFMYEVDGQPWLAAAQTPYQGTNTLSTHVALAVRS